MRYNIPLCFTNLPEVKTMIVSLKDTNNFRIRLLHTALLHIDNNRHSFLQRHAKSEVNEYKSQ